jgi:hypothetical protein
MGMRTSPRAFNACHTHNLTITPTHEKQESQQRWGYLHSATFPVIVAVNQVPHTIHDTAVTFTQAMLQENRHKILAMRTLLRVGDGDTAGSSKHAFQFLWLDKSPYNTHRLI